MLDLIINQHEGIKYDETYAPVVKLKAIRIFLAIDTYMNFIVYQMDVKSAFLNAKLKEEVYVKQPLGFESSEFSNHIYKLDKALYGLKQAPRACRSNIQFSSYPYARYQANPKESHLKGTSSLDLGILNAQVLTKKDTQTLTMLNATWTENALQFSFKQSFLSNSSAFSSEVTEQSHMSHSVDLQLAFVIFRPLSGALVLIKITTISSVQHNTKHEPSSAPYINHKLAEHTKKETFKCVSDFTSKCCLREPFTRSPNMYKEYLAEFWYSSKALENSKVSFFVSTGGIYGEVKLGYGLKSIGLGNTILQKGLSKGVFCLLGELINGNRDYPVFRSQWYLKLLSPQGTNPGAKPRHKKHSTSSKQPSVSCSEATKGNDASANFTTEADLKIFAPNDSVPHQQGDGSQTAHTVSGTKVDTRSAFMDDEDQDDEPFITPEESNEENAERNKDTHNQKLKQDKENVSAKIATLKAQFVFLNINQLTEHLVSSMKPEFSKLLFFDDFICSIPTKLKELPTKITALSREVNELKKHIKEFEVELPEVAELKKHKWELPKEFLDLPGQNSSVQSHIQTLSTPGSFKQGKLTTSHTEGEKNTNPITEDAELANLVDLIGINVAEEYYKKKLLYNKFNDKMLKRKKIPKITYCKVLKKKGPITLKIYREDGSEEVISNLKVSDLHLAEWREVIQVCPDKSEKGWKTIYALVKTRLDQLTQTEQNIKIDLNKPLKEQDPLNELNELANKKRKRAGDFSDEPRLAKKVKSSVQR
ncbi:copia protein [Tanacetum coccineum]